MKVAGEPVVCHSNVSPKLVPKCFECDSDAFDSTGMKLTNQNELLDHHEEDANQSSHGNNTTTGWIASNHDCSGLDDFKDEYDKVKTSVPPLTNSPKEELFEEDSEFYMEKSIIECQLPELIVCYKENICNIVKDICIDEGVPSQNKLLYDTSVDEKAVCTILLPEKDWNDELTGEPEKILMFTSDNLEHSQSCNENSPKQCNSEDLTRASETEYDMAYFIENDIINLSMTNLVAESSKPSVDNNDEVHPQSELVSLETTNLEVPTLFSAAEESNSNTKETTAAYTTTVPAFEEPKKTTVVNDLSYDSKSDHGTITFNFNSLASSANNGMEECHDNNRDVNSSAPSTSASADCQENSSSNVLACSDKCRLQGPTSNSERVEYEDLAKLDAGTLSVSSRVQHSIGESSFASLGSLMCNSGRMGYSGSISLRSDSSTTSTRSFAFPILQSEWNSSPVRMAKADRKHFRKYRCWKQGLLCCRF